MVKFVILAVLLTLPVIIKAEAPESKEIDSLLRNASSFESEGNYKMACELYSQAIAYNDSISKIEYDNDVMAVRSENQIDELYLANKRQSNKILMNAIIFIVILALLFTALFLLLKKRNKLFRQQMEDYVSKKNESENSRMVKNREFSRIIHEVDKPIRNIASSRDKSVIKESLAKLRKIIIRQAFYKVF